MINDRADFESKEMFEIANKTGNTIYEWHGRCNLVEILCYAVSHLDRPSVYIVQTHNTTLYFYLEVTLRDVGRRMMDWDKSMFYRDHNDPIMARVDEVVVGRIRLAHPFTPDDISWHLMSYACRPRVVYVLLNLGANVNERMPYSNETALMRSVNWACARAQAVNLLLDHGADPTLIDNRGRSVWDHAVAAGTQHWDILACLLKRVGIPWKMQDEGVKNMGMFPRLVVGIQMIIMCLPLVRGTPKIWLKRDLIQMLSSYLY